ncbi:MAG: cysteine desulfurase [Pirellulales bacterium]|nr:cysteine desulfurase [Pirellulales bacterium]
MPSLIYLDHNATTPQLPEVVDAVRDATLRYWANPGSQHEAGRLARRVLEDAREQIGSLLGARMGGPHADRVIFTSGGTEANNLALLGLADSAARSSDSPRHLVVSAIEHPSVQETVKHLALGGWEIDFAPADRDGVVSFEQFEPLLRDETRLVSLMLGNNETGVLQPVLEVADQCARRNIIVHTDAAQVAGKLPIRFADLNVAALACTAHKFHGPIGIGVLLLRDGVPLQPTLFGGHQQGALRPGTESVALAVGMAMALECWHREAISRRRRVAELRDRFEQVLTAELPELAVIGRLSKRLPNTSNISFIGFDRQALLMALDLEGVACSTGSACASGSSEPSPVLEAMGLERDIIDGSIRFSLGATTTEAEATDGAYRILAVCKRLQQASSG